MTFQALIAHKSTKPILGGIITALLGWQVCRLPFGEPLENLSYDLPFVFTAPGAPTNLVLVEMDEISHTELHQTYGERWDRRLHAQLLNYLHTDGAGLVVFDVVFTELDKDASKDFEFAQAIRTHERVVVAADVDKSSKGGLVGMRIVPPNDLVRAAGVHWGPTQTEMGSDGVVRGIFPGTELTPPLPWVAASLVTSMATNVNHFSERWIRYYGPGGTLAHVSYHQATNQTPRFYRGKTVFIGGRPKTRFVTEEVDEFLTPWRRHGQPQISGLELTATEFLNLSRGDFLRRLSSRGEIGILLLASVVFGALVLLRPVRALLSAVVGIALIVTLALLLCFKTNHWFNWSMIALVQIPCALSWALGWRWWQLHREKEWLETPLPTLWDDLPTDKKQPTTATEPKDTTPLVPDHQLLRQIGRGAYGDVWLARDVLGNFHAVKIVRRIAFDHAVPYDREFRGLQQFTPVSRSHPGLVHILHVGRNATEDYFFYVMEAGDDEKSGPAIDPPHYTPRNLARDLHRRAPLPRHECIEIMIALCEALEFLHGQGLIHRDIKPANIIFVNNRPKLADVGLVTSIDPDRQRVSFVGTEGYLPPEGPGTTAGDLFALGKVLEEMARPPLPPDAATSPVACGEFQAIVTKACAPNPADRFQSAREMRAALLNLAPANEGPKLARD